MTTLDAINAAILDRPDDDTPRGAYADWLDDHAGDTPDPPAARARAEFIRVQLELAKPAPKPPRRPSVVGTIAMMAFPFGGGVLAMRRMERYKAALEARVEAVAERERQGFRERELWRRWGLGELPAFAPDLPGEAPSYHVMDGRCEISAGVGVALRYVVRRGFVDEARMPLAAFAGEACPTCLGERIVPRPTPGGRLPSMLCTCPQCSGGGVLSGHAAALFRSHPITRVVATDVAIIERPGWSWCIEPPGWPAPIIDPRLCLAHRTRDDALDALSRALVRWGRQQAGESAKA